MTYKNFVEPLLSVLLGIYPEVELLDLMAILFLVFGGTPVLLSTATAPFYMAANGHNGPNFSTSLPTLVLFCWLLFFFFIVDILTGVKWFLKTR